MVQQLRFIEVSEVEELFVNQLRLGGRGNWLMVHAKWPSHLRGRERRFTGRRQRPCVSSPPKSGLISAGVQNITYAHVADPRSPSRDGHLFAGNTERLVDVILDWLAVSGLLTGKT